jgi:hypothetical protein
MPTYTNAQYVNGIGGTPPNVGINVQINGVQSYVPCVTGNVDYDNMMLLVSEGKLTIAPAA